MLVGASVANAGIISFTSASVSVTESAGAVTLDVVRTGDADGFVSVDFASANGSATGGADYASIAGTLSWADGDTSTRTITVPIVDDGWVEGEENFLIRLLNPSIGAELGSNSETEITIIDNDILATIAFGNTSLAVNESDGTVTLSATRQGNSTGPISVDFATADGSATGGADYIPIAGTLSWADGDMGVQSITVPIIDDSIVEPDENFFITLMNPQGQAELGVPNIATIQIVGDLVDVPEPGTLGLLGLGLLGLALARRKQAA